MARRSSDGVASVSAHADHSIAGCGPCCRATAGASCGPVQGVGVPHHAKRCKHSLQAVATDAYFDILSSSMATADADRLSVPA